MTHNRPWLTDTTQSGGHDPLGSVSLLETLGSFPQRKAAMARWRKPHFATSA
jgi:hypothetical protein